MVLLQRQPNRRILNTDELFNMTRSTDRPLSISSVVMETLSFTEQLRVARCARVMIGVQGAGLQWAMFMKPGSALIEIAWPRKGWSYYYSDRVYDQNGTTYNDLYISQIETDNVFLDYKAYVDFLKWRLGDIFTATELLQLADRNVADQYDWFDIYPGRVSDAVLDPEVFLSSLKKSVENVHAYDQNYIDMNPYTFLNL